MMLVAVLAFVGVASVASIDWLLSWWFDDDMNPLPTGRYLVTQGRNTYHADTEAEAVAMAQNYGGVTRIERRSR